MANNQRRLLQLDEAEPRTMQASTMQTTQAQPEVRTLSASTTAQPRARQVAATSASPPPATTTAPVTAQPVLSNVQQNETVQGQLRQLLDSGNPLLTRARDRAVTYAAGRGLQNSTMAAQAGEAAFIDAAAPIAAADAQTFSQRALVNVDTRNRFGLNEQTGNINSRLQSEQGDINSRLQREHGDISSRLQGEQGDINSRLQREQGEIRRSEIKLQGEIEERLVGVQFQNQQSLMLTEFAQRMNLSTHESGLQVERMNVQHRQTLEQIEANASAQTRTDSATYSRQLGGSYLTAISNRQAQASAEVQQIYSTQGLSSTQQQQAVANAYARMQSDMAALAAFYSSAPAWDDSWNVSPGGQHPIMAQPHPIPAQTPVQENPTERWQRIIDQLLGRRG